VLEHSVLTRTLFNNTLITGGKEGGGAENACGLDCSLKSCDLEMLLQGGNVRPVEHGFPSRWLWEMGAIGRGWWFVCLKGGGRTWIFGV
jgi:hypothetical protein